MARGMAMVAALVFLVGASVGAQAQGVRQPDERFVLTGLVHTDGEHGLAWLQEPNLTQNKVVAVRPGDSIGPYKLTSIHDDRVVMEGPTGTFAVPLLGGNSPAGAAVASGAPAVGRPAGAPGAPAPAVMPAARPVEAVRADVRPELAALTAVRERMRAELERRAQEEQARQMSQASGQKTDPAKARTTDAGAPAAPGAAVQGAGGGAQSNPNTHYFPIGDPRRRTGFLDGAR